MITSSTSAPYRSVRSADYSHPARKDYYPSILHHIGYRLWPARKAVYSFVGLGSDITLRPVDC
jgi:hypothetical protein